VFILATTERSRVPDTILSRCLSLEFRRLTVAQLTERLRQIADAESIDASDELLVAIAARADGAARDAVGLLDQARLVHVQTPAELAELLGEVDHGASILAALAPDPAGTVDYDVAFAAASAALYAAPRPAAVVGSLVAALRRLVASQGARTAPDPRLVALADAISPQRATAGMRAVWDYHVRIAPALDSDVALDLLIVRLGEALAGAARPGDSARKS
jgi:DNA polymerase III gamma/tau subunit